MAVGLFLTENFSYLPLGTFLHHQQRHHDPMDDDLTTGAWATATPKAQLIVIQEWAMKIVQHLMGATAPFGMGISLQEPFRYVCLLVLEDYALQVCTILVLECYPVGPAQFPTNLCHVRSFQKQTSRKSTDIA